MREFVAGIILAAMLCFVIAVVSVSVIVIVNALIDDPLDWRAESGFPYCPGELIIGTTEGYECAPYSITEDTK